jgi:hypothetical protein
VGGGFGGGEVAPEVDGFLGGGQAGAVLTHLAELAAEVAEGLGQGRARCFGVRGLVAGTGVPRNEHGCRQLEAWPSGVADELLKPVCLGVG